MIFTTSALLQLAFAATTILLVVVAAWKAVDIWDKWGKVSQEERYELEKGAYLTTSAVVIVLVVRLFMVPQFFWTMEGFIPSVPGAMCLWGVFNLMPTLAWGDLAVKFILPIFYVGWLMVAAINSRADTNPAMRGLMAFFLVASPLALLDSALDLYIMWGITPTEVSCCSNAIDVGIRPIPAIIAGFSGQTLLLAAFIALSAVFALAAYGAGKSRKWLIASLALSPMLAYTYILTMTEVLAPWLLRLPFHHCPFCLLMDHPPAIICTALIWVGISGPWWMQITGMFGRNPETTGQQRALREKLAVVTLVCVLTALFIIGVDVLATLTT